MNLKVVKINHDKCLSCYRCISVCPVKFCNDASGENIIVHSEICIKCGKCIDACSHKARYGEDDFEEAFTAIENNKKCAILIDSPINASFSGNVSNLNNFFKKNGISTIIEAGFGHELCAKKYAEYINSKEIGSIVLTSVCPVIVNYIELYKPHLLQYLAPIDSPIMHAVHIIRSQYHDLKDHELFYISPCLAKKQEFTKTFDDKVYNITYKKISDYLDTNNIDIKTDYESENVDYYDSTQVFPTTNWLGKNIKKYISDDIEIRKITGIHDVIRYLESFNSYDFPSDKKTLIDLLSCKGGCEGGSGTTVPFENQDKLIRHTLKYVENIKDSVMNHISHTDIVNKYYDLIKSGRKFNDRSSINWVEKPKKNELEQIFISLYKNSHNDIKNCSSCGYHECDKMATAIYNNLNKTQNCHFFLHQKLSYLAFHDDVTGLLNRTAFYSRMEESINLEIKFNITNPRIILILDIWGFREINETLGNDVGDEVLVRTATRLRSVLSDGDQLFRIGSDEFAIVMNGEKTEAELESYVDDVNSLFTTSMYIDDNELFISMNCGASVFPLDGDTSSVVIKNAETALHEAKFIKKDFVKFTVDMHIRTIERLNIINSLRNALEKHEFELYYQPQYSSHGHLIGAEALIRWVRPEFGIVSPDRFIPLAEESGLIVPIGEWVIDTVCKDFVKIRDLGLDLTLSANLSVRQFRDKELINKIEVMMNKYNIDKNKMHLEITESFIMDNASESVDKLKQLSDMGLKISLDDFGTGYSCLGYLNHLSLDVLKIDKSFIDQITSESVCVPLVDTIVSMAMGMGLDVVAEGVSELHHVEYLRKFDFDIIMQGYYFGRPVPFDTFIVYAMNDSLKLPG